MKKLFGGIDLTWKKLIIFAILAGVYTAVMAILPITSDTSFRDIAVYMEWWIFFGIIIISNSKSPRDSALKCFVFFLISQPLIYLIQVPFSELGFGLFRYYKYWFLWTLACLPMGYIGYYIKQRDLISAVILLPMLLLLALMAMGYYSQVTDRFPRHLLSLIACILMILVIVWNLIDKKSLKLLTLGIVAAVSIVYIVLQGGISSREFESYKVLDEFNLPLEGDICVSYFGGTSKGNVEIVVSNEKTHTVKLNGKANGNYYFDILDEAGHEYHFEYHFDREEQTVVLNRID